MEKQVLSDLFETFCGAAQQNFLVHGEVDPFFFAFSGDLKMYYVIPSDDKDETARELQKLLRSINAVALIHVSEAWKRTIATKDFADFRDDYAVCDDPLREEVVFIALHSRSLHLERCWKIDEKNGVRILVEEKLPELATVSNRFVGDYFDKEG